MSDVELITRANALLENEVDFTNWTTSFLFHAMIGGEGYRFSAPGTTTERFEIAKAMWRQRKQREPFEMPWMDSIPLVWHIFHRVDSWSSLKLKWIHDECLTETITNGDWSNIYKDARFYPWDHRHESTIIILLAMRQETWWNRKLINNLDDDEFYFKIIAKLWSCYRVLRRCLRQRVKYDTPLR